MKIAPKRLVRDEKGQAMLLALILLLISGLMAAPLLAHMGSGLLTGQVYETRTAELYAADAGVEDAMWKVQNGTEVKPPVACGDPTSWNYTISDVNGKSVAYNITYVRNTTGAEYTITSVATTGNKSHTTVEAYVRYASDWGNILDYGIVALNGSITIDATSVLDSFPEPNKTHIYANGDILNDKQSRVYGRATATGTIANINSIIPGPALAGQARVDFVLPDMQKYFDAANSGVLYPNGLTINGQQSLGPARIMGGDLNIQAGAVVTLGGPVWVDRQIKAVGGSVIRGEGPLVAVDGADLGGGAAPLAEKMPVIVSTQGEIKVSGNADNYMVLYAPQGRVTVTGNPNIQGSIIGKEVYLNVAKKVSVTYNTIVVARVRVFRITVLTWQVSRL
jgi:hypothetical protein